jgi:hypothetical protein
MVKSRTTRAARGPGPDADRHVWEAFRRRLDALHTLDQAIRLVNEAPPAFTPGRKYHANLGFFMGAFTVPVRTTYTEKALYLQFIQRLNAAGALKPAGGRKIEDALRRAMAAQGDS